MNLTFSIIFLRPNFNEPDCFLQDSGSLDGRTKLWLFRWMQFWPSSVIWLEERKRTIDPPLKRKIPNAIEHPRHFPTLESLSIKKYFGIYLKSFVGKNVVFLSLVRRQCAILQFSFCKHLTSSWRSYRWKRQFFSLWWKGEQDSDLCWYPLCIWIPFQHQFRCSHSPNTLSLPLIPRDTHMVGKLLRKLSLAAAAAAPAPAAAALFGKARYSEWRTDGRTGTTTAKVCAWAVEWNKHTHTDGRTLVRGRHRYSQCERKRESEFLNRKKDGMRKSVVGSGYGAIKNVFAIPTFFTGPY